MRSLVLLLSLTCHAASHYIRVSATGTNDGSSWANAFNSIPTRLIRGDIYYIAGGVYPGNLSLTSPESGTTRVTLKKANPADNATDIGWDGSYASTQAVIQGNVDISNSYMTLDGVTGSGEAGYGIKIVQTAGSAGSAIVNQASGTSSMQVLHLEIQGPGMGYAVGVSGYKNNNTQGTVKDNRYAYLYVHDVTQNGFVFVNAAGTSYSDYGLLFENNVLKNSGDNLAGQHGQGIQCGSGAAPSSHSYWIVRNNDFHNVIGTAMIACLGYSTNDHFQIYNNLFRNDNLSYNSGWIAYNTQYPATSPGAIYFSSTSQSADHILVANNDFYQLSRSTVYIDGTATNNTVTNNLWINGNFNIVTQGAIGSYNDYYGCFTIISYGIYGVPYGETGQQAESGNPVDVNFRLLPGTKAIGGGQNLSSEFTTDAAGAVRPASGAWDIGAYQYSGTSAGVSAPTNLQVTIH